MSGRDWSGSLAKWGLWFFVGRRIPQVRNAYCLQKPSPHEATTNGKPALPPKKNILKKATFYPNFANHFLKLTST